MTQRLGVLLVSFKLLIQILSGQNQKNSETSKIKRQRTIFFYIRDYNSFRNLHWFGSISLELGREPPFKSFFITPKRDTLNFLSTTCMNVFCKIYPNFAFFVKKYHWHFFETYSFVSKTIKTNFSYDVYQFIHVLYSDLLHIYILLGLNHFHRFRCTESSVKTCTENVIIFLYIFQKIDDLGKKESINWTDWLSRNFGVKIMKKKLGFLWNLFQKLCLL